MRFHPRLPPFKYRQLSNPLNLSTVPGIIFRNYIFRKQIILKFSVQELSINLKLRHIFYILEYS